MEGAMMDRLPRQITTEVKVRLKDGSLELGPHWLTARTIDDDTASIYFSRADKNPRFDILETCRDRKKPKAIYGVVPPSLRRQVLTRAVKEKVLVVTLVATK